MNHLRRITLILALVAPAALTGCGGEDTASAQGGSSSAQTGSCNNAANISTCTDLSGDAFALGESLQRSMCEAANGTFAMNTACPTENRVGSCRIEGGQVRRYYSTGNLAYEAATAQSDCTGLYAGTWTAN